MYSRVHISLFDCDCKVVLTKSGKEVAIKNVDKSWGPTQGLRITQVRVVNRVHGPHRWRYIVRHK